MRKFFQWMMVMSLLASALLLVVDYVLVELWSFALLAYFWAIIGLFLLAPLSAILLVIPPCRKNIGGWNLALNMAVPILLVVLVEHSEAIEALMHV